MKRYVRAWTDEEVIFSSEYFDFIRQSGIGMKDTPWTGLAVRSKGLAKKHVIEVRLNTKGFFSFEGDPVDYKYSDAYVSQGIRSQSNSLEETEEVIEVLQAAVDFAHEVNDWLVTNQ